MKTGRYLYGLPVATADNILDIVSELGVDPWPHTQPVMPLDNYRQLDLTEEERQELDRFAPKVEVLTLAHPGGSIYHGFRHVGRDWAGVFTLLPDDFVPVVGGYLHSSDQVQVSLPAGGPTKNEKQLADPWTACAKREFEDETGIYLDRVERLTASATVIAGGQSTMRYYPCLGYPRFPIEVRRQELDESEKLGVVLMPIEEWLRFFDQGNVEDCSVTTTYLALRRLGLLNIS